MPPKRSREEVKQMHSQYMSGKTLRDIGKQNNLSYERVRQLFNQYDLVPRRTRIDSVRRYERMVEAWERKDEIIDAYKRLGNVHSVVEETGMRRKQVEMVLGHFKHRATYRNRGGTQRGSYRYSSESIKESLREAAKQYGQPLTVVAYTRYAEGKPCPTNLTVMNRFGSWRAACDAAGVESNRRNYRELMFDNQACADALRKCAKDRDGTVPSYTAYDAWARKQSNRAPSGATIRKRFGSWSQALESVFTE